jgi:hypothetical protein
VSPDFLRRYSLKARVTLLALAVFALGMWSLAFYASRMLRADIEFVSDGQWTIR